MILPDLAPRFLPPAGWEDGEFKNNEHRLIYGCAFADKKPKSAVVILAGRSEFREKYFETMHDLLARGHAVFIMDWYGQGRSERLSGNPQKDWNIPYETHLSDLNEFIHRHVRPRLPAHTPLYMLAHSMGGNIGLRYLEDFPTQFNVAALSAPMLGLKALYFMPLSVSVRIAGAFNPEDYVFGGGDGNETSRQTPGAGIFSTDPVRDGVHMAWVRANPELQHGDATFGWIKNSLTSCEKIFTPGALEKIKIPCVIATARRESLVDNRAALRAARRISDITFLDLPDARHEIIMERDGARDAFLKAFDNLAARVNMAPA